MSWSVEYDVNQCDKNKIYEKFKAAYKRFEHYQDPNTEGGEPDCTSFILYLNNFVGSIHDLVLDENIKNHKFKIVKFGRFNNICQNGIRAYFVFETDPYIDKVIKAKRSDSIKQKIYEFLRDCDVPRNSVYIKIPNEITYANYGDQDICDWLQYVTSHMVEISYGVDGKSFIIEIFERSI